MNGVNKWKDELAAMTRERNRLNDLHESQKRVNAVLREELAINREALARLTERIRELEAQLPRANSNADAPPPEG